MLISNRFHSLDISTTHHHPSPLGRFTERLLEEHEAELERLRHYYETNLALFKVVKDHQNLWNKMIEL